MAEQSLGRIEPPDWEHVDKYPLRAVTIEDLKPAPVVFGFNWYYNFFYPKTKTINGVARYVLPQPNEPWGSYQGGHCIVSRPEMYSDLADWWKFYNQGNTGRCVGFGWSRCQTLWNRTRYNAGWLYDECTLADGIPGNEHDVQYGTTVRAGGYVLANKGHMNLTGTIKPAAGIQRYRWALNADEVFAALKSPKWDAMGMVPLLNSWGEFGWPHQVFVSHATIQKLLSENGEAAIPTDR